MSKHTPYKETDRGIGGHQKLYRFPNGYGASLISGGMLAYGGLEMAILKFEGDSYVLTYDTPITTDVLGHLDPSEVDDLLDQVEALEKPSV
jgi:hypothetical protein